MNKNKTINENELFLVISEKENEKLLVETGIFVVVSIVDWENLMNHKLLSNYLTDRIIRKKRNDLMNEKVITLKFKSAIYFKLGFFFL